MNELQVFSNELGEVRVVFKGEEPLFCLSDVCKILELTSSSKTKNIILSEFELGELDSYSFDTGYGIKEFSMITEQQLYFIMNRSDKPKAKPFRKWVNCEVLPQIRKTGSYGVKPLTLKESLLLNLQLVEENERLQLDNRRKTEKIDNYETAEAARRSKQELATRLNRTIRKLAQEKFDSDYKAAYNYIFKSFADTHCINEKINIEFLKRNTDYLAECLTIATKELQ